MRKPFQTLVWLGGLFWASYRNDPSSAGPAKAVAAAGSSRSSISTSRNTAPIDLLGNTEREDALSAIMFSIAPLTLGRSTASPMLLACSRHASVRSLERYARPGPDAVARHVAATDPAARRRPGRSTDTP